MNEQLTKDDYTNLSQELGRYIEKRFPPFFSRPETILDAAKLSDLIDGAFEQGLLSETLDDGLGLWTRAEDNLHIQFSINSLQQVAYINAGLAYAFHLRALSQRAFQKLVPSELNSRNIRPLLVLQGHYGLARYSLANFLSQPDVDQHDHRILKDYFEPDQLKQHSGYPVSCSTLAYENWSHLICPRIHETVLQGTTIKKTTLQFKVYARAQVECCQLTQEHGLNELQSLQWNIPENSEALFTSKLSHEASQSLYSELLQIHWLALLAIASGTEKHAWKLASDYAGLRVQGGKKIQAHPAVKLLLEKAESAWQHSELMLSSLTMEPASVSTLAQIARTRALLHPLLCEGANCALQVFGGMGYMQDTGLEKIVRDCMQLQLIQGTPTELSLFLDALNNHSETGHAQAHLRGETA